MNGSKNYSVWVIFRVLRELKLLQKLKGDALHAVPSLCGPKVFYDCGKPIKRNFCRINLSFKFCVIQLHQQVSIQKILNTHQIRKGDKRSLIILKLQNAHTRASGRGLFLCMPMRCL